MAEQFDSSRPIYAQLVERLEAKILAGIYPPGGHLIEQLRAEAARNLTAEFLEKMRGIGYGLEQAAVLLERWNEKEETNHD